MDRENFEKIIKERYGNNITFHYVDCSNKELQSETNNNWNNNFSDMYKNISIGFISSQYIETNDIQDKDYEYSKISRFLYKYADKYAQEKGIDSKNDVDIQFINYGKTELVYVLTDKTNNQRVTLLTKQPAVEFGKVKQEADNLTKLKQKDESVVAPLEYFKYGDQELYVTPYINQARCVASNGSWGMYIPEPYYRFERFTDEQERIVNSCMIAKLVSYFDFENQQGIASCKIGGGDFMLPKGWENEEPTYENTLKSLYFIAAREKVSCTFDEYLDIIRDEFSRRTFNENQENLIINHRNRVPMQIEDIEKGIEMGKEIIKNNLESSEEMTTE